MISIPFGLSEAAHDARISFPEACTAVTVENNISSISGSQPLSTVRATFRQVKAFCDTVLADGLEAYEAQGFGPFLA